VKALSWCGCAIMRLMTRTLSFSRAEGGHEADPQRRRDPDRVNFILQSRHIGAVSVLASYRQH
jgi:hypothetical protein